VVRTSLAANAIAVAVQVVFIGPDDPDSSGIGGVVSAAAFAVDIAGDGNAWSYDVWHSTRRRSCKGARCGSRALAGGPVGRPRRAWGAASDSSARPAEGRLKVSGLRMPILGVPLGPNGEARGVGVAGPLFQGGSRGPTRRDDFLLHQPGCRAPAPVTKRGAIRSITSLNAIPPPAKVYRGCAPARQLTSITRRAANLTGIRPVSV
jgi:hypothetical protein